MNKSTLIIIILLILLFGIILTNNDESEYRIDTLKITTIKDSLIPYQVITPKDSIIYKTIYKNDTILRIDTITKIVKEFLTVNNYSDTILDDSIGRIVINDSIYRNKIIYRQSEVNIYQKRQQENNYLIAGTYLRTQDNRLNLGLNLTYEQQKNVYGIGIDKKGFIISYGRKIRFKRKYK